MRNELTKELLLEIIHEVLAEVTESRTTKPYCGSGGKFHDRKGRFTDKASASSFSAKFTTPGGQKGKECIGGQAKMPGQKFAKLPAGRKTKTGGKEKYKLKDGEPAYENQSAHPDLFPDVCGFHSPEDDKHDSDYAEVTNLRLTVLPNTKK